jgi:Skp family chaperone for outer membrane proteins
MRSVRVTSALLVVLLLVTALAENVHAQASVAKVAIANPVKIFNDIQETKDLRTKMESDGKVLEDQRQQRALKLRDLQQERDNLKSDSPAYAAKNQELLEKTIEFRSWFELTQLNIQRQQKMQIKALYDKITNTIAQVANQRGIELVLAEQRPELPEGDIDKVDINQLRAILGQRNVLFNSALVDISDAVVTAMDANYKAGK